MKINVTEDAAKWYKNEFTFSSTPHIRFYPRYGYGGHIPGFSIGINNDVPNKAYTSTTVDGITFYIESEDAWYFDDVNLYISICKEMQEPNFSYV